MSNELKNYGFNFKDRGTNTIRGGYYGFLARNQEEAEKVARGVLRGLGQGKYTLNRVWRLRLPKRGGG
tara:strand:+ start:75 stop:278 length:204 start_codon:yes stop_codon:yes gene_type:complete